MCKIFSHVVILEETFPPYQMLQPSTLMGHPMGTAILMGFAHTPLGLSILSPSAREW
jgi:hypothetical protein